MHRHNSLQSASVDVFGHKITLFAWTLGEKIFMGKTNILNTYKATVDYSQ